jgi:hypothetical protein
MDMENRIIKTEDGFTFVNVTDLALALWATNSVPLFELNDELNEALITSEERLKEVLGLGYVVVMEGGHEEANELRVWTYFDGTEEDVNDFTREWETLLGTIVMADLTTNSDGGDSWYCEAFVSQAQIDEFNMDEDWFTIQ